MIVRLYKDADKEIWDSFVYGYPTSTHCHLSGWKDVIQNTYGHKGYYFLAEEDFKIKGILPLFHIKSLLFGNHLVSMPFLNYGGILADSEEAEKTLFSEAMKIGQQLKVKNIELRHLKPISYLNEVNPINSKNPSNSSNSSNPSNPITKRR